MHAARPRRRGAAHDIAGALLTAGVLTAALTVTAVLAATASAPAALTRPRSPGPGATVAAAARGSRPAAPGWRVAAVIGPPGQDVSGRLSARSARGAWSVWTGTGFTAVERLQAGGWARVPLPARLTRYVRSAVAFDGDSAADFWLFSSYRTTRALRFTGTGWAIAALPPWVLRASAGGGRRAVTAVFGPDDVWVFSLQAGPYAAHYDGRAWAKVPLPGAPDAVSAVAANDIWALDGSLALHWNGRTWATSTLTSAAGGPAPGFGHLTATGPDSAWAWRTTGTPGPSARSAVLHWNGARWRPIAGTPAGLIGSVVPDGSGGLWAAGLAVTPGGRGFLYHLAGGRWTRVSPPAGAGNPGRASLTWVPGTRSLWGTAEGPAGADRQATLIAYRP
jgi:hypothetical protein